MEASENRERAHESKTNLIVLQDYLLWGYSTLKGQDMDELRVMNHELKNYKLNDKVTKVQFEEPILGYCEFLN